MIIGDIQTTEKVEYEDLLKNYYEKMEIIEEQDKEIERLNNIINKAIEYIEKWQSFQHTNGSTHEELRNLKSILKGVDKE